MLVQLTFVLGSSDSRTLNVHSAFVHTEGHISSYSRGFLAVKVEIARLHWNEILSSSKTNMCLLVTHYGVRETHRRKLAFLRPRTQHGALIWVLQIDQETAYSREPGVNDLFGNWLVLSPR